MIVSCCRTLCDVNWKMPLNTSKTSQDEIKALFKKLKEVKVDRKCDAFVGVQDSGNWATSMGIIRWLIVWID